MKIFRASTVGKGTIPILRCRRHNAIRNVLAVFLIVSLTLTACAEVEVGVKERRGFQGAKTVDVKKVDNSKGTETLEQDVLVTKPFTHTVELDLRDSNLNERKVRDKVYEAYEIKSPNGEAKCVFPADVPAGKIYEYEIEWTELKREGDVINVQTQEVLGKYVVIVGFQCQVVGQRVA